MISMQENRKMIKKEAIKHKYDKWQDKNEIQYEYVDSIKLA